MICRECDHVTDFEVCCLAGIGKQKVEKFSLDTANHLGWAPQERNSNDLFHQEWKQHRTYWVLTPWSPGCYNDLTNGATQQPLGIFELKSVQRAEFTLGCAKCVPGCFQWWKQCTRHQRSRVRASAVRCRYTPKSGIQATSKLLTAGKDDLLTITEKGYLPIRDSRNARSQPSTHQTS